MWKDGKNKKWFKNKDNKDEIPENPEERRKEEPPVESEESN